MSEKKDFRVYAFNFSSEQQDFIRNLSKIPDLELSFINSMLNTEFIIENKEFLLSLAHVFILTLGSNSKNDPAI